MGGSGKGKGRRRRDRNSSVAAAAFDKKQGTFVEPGASSLAPGAVPRDLQERLPRRALELRAAVARQRKREEQRALGLAPKRKRMEVAMAAYDAPDAPPEEQEDADAGEGGEAQPAAAHRAAAAAQAPPPPPAVREYMARDPDAGGVRKKARHERQAVERERLKSKRRKARAEQDAERAQLERLERLAKTASKPAFGEVADRPPDLTLKRKGGGKAADTGRLKRIMEEQMKRVQHTAELQDKAREQRELQRQELIQQYRKMKGRPMHNGRAALPDGPAPHA